MQTYSMLTNHKYSEIVYCLLVICAYDSELPFPAFLRLLPFPWPLLMPLCLLAVPCTHLLFHPLAHPLLFPVFIF